MMNPPARRAGLPRLYATAMVLSGVSFCADQADLQVSRGALRREPAGLPDEVEIEVAALRAVALWHALGDAAAPRDVQSGEVVQGA
jgi:hypothetical protein